MSAESPGCGSGQRRNNAAVTATGRSVARANFGVGLRGHRRARFLERGDEVEQRQSEISARTKPLVMLVHRHRAVRDLVLLVDRQQILFGEVLEDVAHTEHDDRVTDDQHSLPAVLARQHLGRAAQPQNHVAPAFSARGPMVELAQQTPELGLVGELFADADGREPVENSEFLFAQPLVDDEGVRVLTHACCLDYQTGGVPRAQVGRRQHDVRPPLRGHCPEPTTQRDRLTFSELRQRHVDVANVDVDHRFARLERRFACDVSRGLPVTRYVKEIGPDLTRLVVRIHASIQVKERTSSAVCSWCKPCT